MPSGHALYYIIHTTPDTLARAMSSAPDIYIYVYIWAVFSWQYMLPHTNMSGTIMSRTQAHHTGTHESRDNTSQTGPGRRATQSIRHPWQRTQKPETSPRPINLKPPCISVNDGKDPNQSAKYQVTRHTQIPHHTTISPTIVNFVANRCQSKTAILRCTETFNLDFSLYLLKCIRQ